MVVLENHSYSELVASASMPYLNSLISTRAVADNYFADTHPSIGNYFMLTAGQIITNDDAFTGVVADDNLVRELAAAGKTWRVYAEDLPSTGYLGGDSGGYLKHHNPFAYFSDVVNSTTASANMVAFTQFASDLSAGTTADFNFIVPNAFDDLHSCPNFATTCTDADLQKTADNWLQTNIGPLLANADFQQRGLLILTVDESVSADTANGGGHVLTLFAGGKAKTAFRSSTFYQQQSTLNLVCTLLGCPAKPGSAANAPAMTEFLNP